jgi:hypothetical protein
MSETNEFEILIKFKSSLSDFFQELIDQFPQEGDLVIAHIFLNNQFPIKSAMDIFTDQLNLDDKLLKITIKDRDEKFFLERNPFDSIGNGKANYFKKLWLSGVLDDENKLIIWAWVDEFVRLSDKYLGFVGDESV